MRILLVHSYYRLRGGEDVVFDAECDLLRNAGLDVHRIVRHNADLSNTGPVRNAATTIWNRAVAREVGQTISEQQIDLVHFHNTFPSISPAPIRAAHLAGAITVQTLHNARQLCPKAVCFRDGQPCTLCVDRRFAAPAILNRCFHDSRLGSSVVAMQNLLHRTARTYDKYLDVAIAPSQFLRDRFAHAGYPISKIEVKPHFVEQHNPIGTGEGNYAVYVGRLSEEKGLPTLLEASQKWTSSLPLRIIGRGPLEADLQQELRSRHQADPHKLQWLGEVEQSEVYRIIGNAAVLILPSHCAESFGRVVIEAFAKGTPVICADQGGQAELVHDGVGALFRSGDSDDLAAKVDRLMTDPRRSTEMRIAARREFEKNYTAEANLQQLWKIYVDAFRRRGRELHTLPALDESVTDREGLRFDSTHAEVANGHEAIADDKAFVGSRLSSSQD